MLKDALDNLEPVAREDANMVAGLVLHLGGGKRDAQR